MQRVPTRQRQAMPADRQQGGRQQNNEASPALLLARRVREEQGVEQLKSFLAAMEPFVAPNELRSICGGFGINHDALMMQSKTQAWANGNNGNSGSQGYNGSHGSNGNNGSSGNNGSHGYNGSNGSQGYNGSQSSHGNNVSNMNNQVNFGSGMGMLPQMPGMGAFQGRNGGNQFQMLQMLMNMPGMMKGGRGDMSQIFKMMGGR